MEPISTYHHTTSLSKVRLHPDGGSFITLSAVSDEICLWRFTKSGSIECCWRLESDTTPEYRILDVAFHPDGTKFVSVGRGTFIELRQTSNGDLIASLGVSRKPREARGYLAATFSSLGNLLIASQIDSQQTEFYELATTKKVRAIWDEVITSFALHPEGELIAAVKAGLRTTGIRFIRIQSDSEIQHYDIELHSHYLIQSIRFNSVGNAFLVIGGIPPLIMQAYSFPNMEFISRYAVNRNIDVYHTDMPLFHKLALEEGDVYDESPLVEGASFVGDRRQVICPGSAGELRQLDLTTNKCVKRWVEHSAIVTSLDVSYGKRILVSCDLDGTIVAWNRVDKPVKGPSAKRPLTESFCQHAKPVSGKQSRRYNVIDLDQETIEDTPNW